MEIGSEDKQRYRLKGFGFHSTISGLPHSNQDIIPCDFPVV